MRQPFQKNTPPADSPAPAQYRQITERVESALAHNDLDCFQSAMLEWFQFPQRHDFPDPVLACCAEPFQPQRLAEQPYQIRIYVLQEIFRRHIPQLIDLTPQIEFLSHPRALAGVPREFRQPFLYLLMVALLLQGEQHRAREIYRANRRQLGSCGLRGWLLFLDDDHAAAIRSFKADLAGLRRREKHPEAYFTGLEGIIMLLALLADDIHRHLPTVKQIITGLTAVQPHNPLLPVYRIIAAVTYRLADSHQRDHRSLLPPPPFTDDAVTSLFAGLARYWLTGRLPPALRPQLQKLHQRASQNNFGWLAAGYQSLLHPTYLSGDSSINPSFDQPVDQTAGPPTTNHPTGNRPETTGRLRPSRHLATLIRPDEAWRQAVVALDLETGDREPPAESYRRRLVWLLSYRETTGQCRIKPVIQQRRADGSWSRGRPMARQRLLEMLLQPERNATADRPTELHASPLINLQDRLLGARLAESDRSYLQLSSLEPELLLDHPRIMLDTNSDQRAQLEFAHPTLLLEQENSAKQDDGPAGLRLRLTPFPAADQVVQRREEGRFQIITFTPEVHELAAQLGVAGRHWPTGKLAELQNFLARLPAELTIYSWVNLELPDSTAITPNDRVIMQFFPGGDGLRLRLRVRPLGPDGPALPPGHGPALLWAQINGRRCHLHRDLARETAAARELAAFCQMATADQAKGPGDTTWTLADPREGLEILNKLQQRQPPVDQEWPAGEQFSVSPTAGLHQLKLKIDRQNDWFGVSGQLQLDDGLVLELDSLLRAARRRQGRFIPLGHNRFLSLSRDLQRKIEEIEAYAELHQDRLQLHPLVARLLLEPNGKATDSGETADHEEWRPAMTVQAEHHWRQFKARLEQPERLEEEPPAGLKTRLRSYQLGGYRWLRQMTDLGLGACLADDMGLGKTIQALALLLARADGGPGLVVAPTSLCLNWQEEAERFAPGLRLLPYQNHQRRRLLKDLRPGDLVICSYGLLQRDAEALGAIHWHTIVLDEAQAIKNFLAKRSRAAMGLKGDGKLITTGTPLENHLSELWTLFRFLNPGLLGSLERFGKKFISPIEEHDDQQARQRLKKLLTPFILRRQKDEVLPELPPRTEITLQVTMHREEAALYEALRRQARETLQNPDEHNRTGAPLQVLAQIMKLRRACCHPRLVLPESAIPGAKLELFARVVEELLENRHRILVFSQFVDHLTIIREHLDRQQISYQYLDGATPAPVRQQRVRAFQQGRGELFLISLRAGGQGLNLTAADYVIHLDPWWNPAVEQQASDRAHRIGQNRPVTIYRLITAGTIEEKIRALHHRKQRLAGDLLDAARSGPPRSYTELLALLEE